MKHIFYSKYTVSWNWFALQRKQKVSWRTSDYHGKRGEKWKRSLLSLPMQLFRYSAS